MNNQECNQLIHGQKTEELIEAPTEICKKIRAKYQAVRGQHQTTEDIIQVLSEEFPCYNVFKSIEPIIDLTH